MATKATRKSRTVQRLVNSFPEWADVRTNHQSTGYQFFNSIGATFDDLFKEVSTSAAALQLATAPINRLDSMYKVKLPKTFEFDKLDDDDTEENYITPTVSGQIDSTFYEVTLTTDNEMVNFIDAVPDRISLIDSYTDSIDCAFVIASGMADTSPLQPLVPSGIIPFSSRLFTTVTSGESYLYVDTNNYPHKGMLKLTGQSKYGYDTNEEDIFLYDDKQITTHEYEVVSGISFHGVSNPDEVLVVIQSMDFMNGPYKSAYYMDYAESGEDIQTFWDIGDGDGDAAVGQSTLDFISYVEPSVELRINGNFVDKYIVYSQELKDSNGDAVLAADLAVEPFSNHIWITDSNSKLYCYSSELPYMNLKSLNGKTPDQSCKIETDWDYVMEGATIDIQFVWATPTKGIKRHRVNAEHEDGTKYILLNSSLLAQSLYPNTDYWVYGEPISRMLRPPVSLTLPKTGLFTFSLEVIMGDDTKEIDKHVIVSSPQIEPLAEFNLTTAGVTGVPAGIHIDDDNYIWILDTSGYLYKLNRHYDQMLIDYTNKIIYLREDYDQIFVDNS